MAEAPTFAAILLAHLTEAGLKPAQAAALWHLDADTLRKYLRDENTPPRTKIGYWATILARPEEEIRAACNATRTAAGTRLIGPRTGQPLPSRRIDTVEQTEQVVSALAHADTEVAS